MLRNFTWTEKYEEVILDEHPLRLIIKATKMYYQMLLSQVVVKSFQKKTRY